MNNQTRFVIAKLAISGREDKKQADKNRRLTVA